MADSLKAAGISIGTLFLAVITTRAQHTAAQTGITDKTPAEPGFVSGSPVLWLLFVIVCIVVIFAIIRRKRNS